MIEPRIVTVTPQQRAVIRELTHDGATNPEIADRLCITEDTVKTHVSRALERVGVPNRTALVVELLRGRVILRVAHGNTTPVTHSGRIAA